MRQKSVVFLENPSGFALSLSPPDTHTVSVLKKPQSPLPSEPVAACTRLA